MDFRTTACLTPVRIHTVILTEGFALNYSLLTFETALATPPPGPVVCIESVVTITQERW